jgi:hypothetical protein
MDNLKLPKGNRVLVLCPDHVEDLCLEDSALVKVFADVASGMPKPLYGFGIKTYPTLVVYNDTTGAKKALGAAAANATDCVASVAYVKSECYRAMGSVDVPAQENLLYLGTLVNVIMRFLAGSIRGKGIAAIRDDA